MNAPADDLRLVLVAYARLAMRSSDVQRAAGGTWQYDAVPFELPPLPEVEPAIEVGAGDIVAAIGRVLDGVRTPVELEEWASIVIMSDAYAVAETGVDLLTPLHRLAAPSLDGGTTAERLQGILRDLAATES